MNPPTRDDIQSALDQIEVPEVQGTLQSLGWVAGISLCGDAVKVLLLIPESQAPLRERILEQARQVLEPIPGLEKIQVDLAPANTPPTEAVSREDPPKTSPDASQDPSLESSPSGIAKKVIAVTSGKGGVGKTTCAVNLAIALAASGQRVGLLDADIYGPNVPLMMGLKGRPEPGTDAKIAPKIAYGVRTISIGYLLEDGQPVMWRGPMLHKALKQFLEDVDWGGLDILIVDMPPGTGDAQLSLSELVPLSGAVVVTTPQEVSLTDVRRAIGMCRQVKCGILGVIENMSGSIFGTGGGRKTAEEFALPFLGEIHLESDIRLGGDSGKPVFVAAPDSSSAQAFAEIAQKILKEARKQDAMRLPVIDEMGAPISP